MGQCYHKRPSLTRHSYLTPHEGHLVKPGDGWQGEWQFNWLPELLVIKIIWHQNNLTNWLSHQFTTPTNKGKQWRTLSEHSKLSSIQPLIRGLGPHKLSLGIWVGLISSHLTVDKLFPINQRTITGQPKMAHAWGQKHACIDHQTKAYHCDAHGWPWLVHNTN